MDDAEPLEEDRVVPFSEDSETVMVDGILMSTNCTLKVLRAGCSSLGLSGRGSKSKCLKRMVEHVRAQTLLAAHGAEIKMRNELERAPVAQTKPDEPSQQEVENHSLTMSRSELGAHFACSIVQNKIHISQAPMNLQGIQCCQWTLVFAAERKTKQTSLHVFSCMTGQRK